MGERPNGRKCHPAAPQTAMKTARKASKSQNVPNLTSEWREELACLAGETS